MKADHFSFYQVQKHPGKMDAEATTFGWLCTCMSEFAPNYCNCALTVYQDGVL